MRNARLGLLTIAAAIAFTNTADAQARLEAGTLTCKGKGSVGMILGSKHALSCVFSPAGGGPRQTYAATITKVGIDVGVTGPTTMVWTVLYSTQSVPSGALAGTYAGASAGASVGIGGGANVLVGGSKNSVGLQPVSVQGQTGLNLAVGVSELSLVARSR